MAARLVHASAPAGRGIAALGDASPGALLLAVAVPLLFLHRAYQPALDLHLGATTVTAYLADFAVLAAVLAALAAGLREGWSGLRPGRVLWLVGAAFLVWVGLEVLYGHHRSASYATTSHLVSALKFAEYLLLAPAIALLVRTRDDLLALLWGLVLWTCAATAAGIAQFLGADILLKHFTGGRTSSFIGYDDYSALAVGVLLVGLAGLVLPRLGLGRALISAAILAGGIGGILSGALAAVLGLVTAAAVLALLLRLGREGELRRVAAGAAIVAVVSLGAVAIRSSDLSAFARFLGASQQKQANVQTYSHRTLLAWIGWEIWKGHPLLGVGWLGSAEPASFEPYLPAAHARFPTLSKLDFPSRAHPWGVQDAWIQSGADLGVVGFLLWAGSFAAAAWVALRGGVRRVGAAPLLGLLGVAALLWLFTAQGFFAGIPLDGLLALAFGLAATRTQEAR
ncbi:MAG TPA: O-antigen ligase family protein [Gaiellaceae bacterium]|nr:O-antigen ligase family protein [Gaiellaceae bacterium]